jgi:bifunctional non-homologous end joining protein LigD
MVRATREYDLEGVVAKRLDGRYLPGRRSRSWGQGQALPASRGGRDGLGAMARGLSGPLAVGRWDPAAEGARPQL